MKTLAEQLTPLLHSVPSVTDDDDRPSPKHCSICDKAGHNARTCPMKQVPDRKEELWERAFRLQRPASFGDPPWFARKP